MKLNYRLIAALMALGAGATLSAQPADATGPEGQRGRGHRPPPDPVIVALDTNRDHVISTDEIAAASQVLIALDENNDGTLSLEELRPTPPANCPAAEDDAPPPEARRGDGPRRGSAVIRALDVDQDKQLSGAEIANAGAILLTLDKNEDGQLTVKEFHPRPPKGDRPAKR